MRQGHHRKLVLVASFSFTPAAPLHAQSGSTPLHSAAGTNRFDVVRYLIEQEADLTLRDDDEKTPYEVAKSEGHTQCTYNASHRRAEVH